MKTRRQALHGRLFDILRQRGDVPPEILAQHAEAAGQTATSIDCWERAGEEAIARPAYKEAIAHLEAAIRLCRQLSADPEWLRRECQLQIRLGQALAGEPRLPGDGHNGRVRARKGARRANRRTFAAGALDVRPMGEPLRFGDAGPGAGDPLCRADRLRGGPRVALCGTSGVGPGALPRGSLPSVAAAPRGSAFGLRPGRPPGSRAALRTRSAHRRHELQGVEPCGISGSRTRLARQRNSR